MSPKVTWPLEALVVTVANVAIDAELGHGTSGIEYGAMPGDGPLFLVPGVHTLPGPVDALRFKNHLAAAGDPTKTAQVSIRPAPGKALEGGVFSSLSGLEVDAAGNVAYDFAGHVHARGLDLDAATGPTLAADNSVRWLRTTDGAMIAAVQGSAPDSHRGSLAITAQKQSAAHPSTASAYVFLNATDADTSEIDVQANAFGQSSYLRRLIGHDNGSDWTFNETTIPALTTLGPIVSNLGNIAAHGSASFEIDLGFARTAAVPIGSVFAGNNTIDFADSCAFAYKHPEGWGGHVGNFRYMSISVHNCEASPALNVSWAGFVMCNVV